MWLAATLITTNKAVKAGPDSQDIGLNQNLFYLFIKALQHLC